eukprot:TRINITY_DN7593_c0_g1_i4.p2 TRINITY_DN7593_c0_g1~~TRINITY_DN7593_c0_g1_i4.p2  ORF type:complete len:145 (+),score=18.21 TRINITY_DN7593_c0_g1_i4:194-628(+)
MSAASNVLVPAKFIILICHLLAAVVIIRTRPDNIFAGLSVNAIYGSDEYQSADASIMGAVALSILLLMIEIFIQFIGFTIFYDKINILQIILHGLGALLYSWFILEQWHYITLWYLWAIFGFAPFFIEFITACGASIRFRGINK